LSIETAVSVVTGGGIFAGVIFVLCLNAMAMSRAFFWTTESGL
jgi:hypothetical protein